MALPPSAKRETGSLSKFVQGTGGKPEKKTKTAGDHKKGSSASFHTGACGLIRCQKQRPNDIVEKEGMSFGNGNG